MVLYTSRSPSISFWFSQFVEDKFVQYVLKIFWIVLVSVEIPFSFLILLFWVDIFFITLAQGLSTIFIFRGTKSLFILCLFYSHYINFCLNVNYFILSIDLELGFSLFFQDSKTLCYVIYLSCLWYFGLDSGSYKVPF